MAKREGPKQERMRAKLSHRPGGRGYHTAYLLSCCTRMKSLHTRWPRQCNNCKIENNILKAKLDRIFLFLVFALVLQARTLSVIIDTDAGSDDLIAIAFLLSRTDVHVEAINVVSGVAHVPRGAENIRKLLALGRREDIPVHLGREQPIQGTAEFPAVWRKTA